MDLKTLKNKQLPILRFIGIRPFELIFNLCNLGWYWKTKAILKKQKGNDTQFCFGRSFPILDEKDDESGTMNGHYFHQDLYVARKIFENNPTKHIDIGSRVDGLVAHIAAFRTVEILDIRHQESKVRNIHFRQADLMKLPDGMIDYCDSISSLHAIEHFGLGRYGDPIDYLGHVKAIENISKILRKDGVFYFSVPIGKQRIEFNAHRVFSVQYLFDLLEDKFEVKTFVYVDDHGDLHESVTPSSEDREKSFECTFGCGIFELIKK